MFLSTGGVALTGSVTSRHMRVGFAVVNAAVIRPRPAQRLASLPLRLSLAVSPIPLPTVLAVAIGVTLLTRIGARDYPIAGIPAAAFVTQGRGRQ